MSDFFGSDYHIAHVNILKYDNRPFKTIEEMKNCIIQRHNERVKPDDTMNYLGDLGFWASQNRAFRGEGQPYNPHDFLAQMNGRYWNFIKGNHDKSSNKFKPKIETSILNQNGLRIQLIHDPTYAKIDYDLIICGHVHNSWKIKELHYCGETRLIINVGCCLWNYYPVSLEEILTIYHRWKHQRKKMTIRYEQPEIIKELNKGLIHEEK